MDKSNDEGFALFCAAQGVKNPGQFADDVRPAFDAGVAHGHAVGFAAGSNTKENERSNAQFNREQLRKRMVRLYQLESDATWFDIAGAAELHLSGLKARTAIGRVSVDAGALRSVLTALIGAPHLIRELQATREPKMLFPDNPINVLLRDLQGVS